jgi:hypothetical protein
MKRKKVASFKIGIVPDMGDIEEEFIERVFN